MMAFRSSNGELLDKNQAGFTYVGVLIAVAVLGIGLSVTSEVWTKTTERQKRLELEWVGEQYIQAIQSYYYANVGPVHSYPAKLEDLLLDKRYPSTRRHIRRLYPDPFSGRVQWKLVSAPLGGIRGVEFDGENAGLAVSRQFIFQPQDDPSATGRRALESQTIAIGASTKGLSQIAK